MNPYWWVKYVVVLGLFIGYTYGVWHFAVGHTENRMLAEAQQHKDEKQAAVDTSTVASVKDAAVRADAHGKRIEGVIAYAATDAGRAACWDAAGLQYIQSISGRPLPAVPGGAVPGRAGSAAQPQPGRAGAGVGKGGD